ncbi:hypothetical protein PSA5_11605 [Pseudomonas syringae pv. actinidiae]|nr:hypothetical protein PSA5_11605 [Pseudomonas syringae pv. actinidiae]
MRLTFHLRTGVTFHSGNPLTAQDVAWSLQRVVTLNKALASTWKAYGYTAKNVSELMRAEGPSTFVLDLPKATDRCWCSTLWRPRPAHSSLTA